ncbi:MAG TPA: CAP domain-containing protein [Candidatus Dormibacteraeota bacterium]|nr:CAP domain-containing protein [Candidatus Dormibacteraeota bacterium]
MIHYSQYATRRASRLPLLGAVASLVAIAIWLGDPQAGVGMAHAARVPVATGPTIGAPVRLTDQRSLRLRDANDAPPIATLAAGPAGLPQAAIALFNRDRAQAGLPPLNESLVLDGIASTRAQQMLTDGLTHVRPGRTAMAVTELLHQNGVAYTWNGENIFWSGGPPFDGAISSADVWWMNSPEHKDNILGAHFRQVGIGTAIDGGKMYISAIFTD